jgi:hypothetical protein
MIASLPAAKALIRASWARTWPVLRPTLGWCMIGIGVLGIILPIIPGLPFLFPGIALVGRRSVALRWAAVQVKRQLRRRAGVRLPLLGPVGRWALGAQHQISRQRRRMAWWHMERRRRQLDG